jgi:hypothetical protein
LPVEPDTLPTGTGITLVDERLEIFAANPNRRPIRSAGSEPWSIQFLTVCWFSFSIAATSATVRNSSTLAILAKPPARQTGA